MDPSDTLTNITLSACFSALITGIGAWLLFGRDKITRPEMEAIVLRLTDKMDSLVENLNNVMVEQSRLSERLEAYLTVQDRRTRHDPLR